MLNAGISSPKGRRSRILAVVRRNEGVKLVVPQEAVNRWRAADYEPH